MRFRVISTWPRPLTSLVALCCCTASSPADQPEQTLAGLLAADQAYGANALTTPFTKRAESLFADGIVLQSSSLVVGRSVAIARLEKGRLGSGARASWHPVRAGISADGDAGFTYGYMTITRGDSTYPAKYLAFWVRADGAWRMLSLKVGGRPDGSAPTKNLPPVLPAPSWPRAPQDSLNAVLALADAERSFGRAGARDLPDAFAVFGDSLAGHMGQSSAFLYGRSQIVADLRASGPGVPITWGPEIVHVSRSGDLGLSAGYITVAGDTLAPPQPFVTIWRRAAPGAPWRYIAE